MTISKIQKRRGLNFAKVLAEIAAKAPDDQLKKQVYRVVNDTRQKYGYTWWQKRDEVERCVRLGASTIDDLMHETPFNKQEIQELLNELVAADLVRKTHSNINPTGPKVMQYFPKGQ